jgi:aspartate racemase
MNPLLGVLGGMGPLATVDFLGKLVEETPARRDAEHIPVIVWSVPQIPDRPMAILEAGESPLPAMLAGIRTLKGAGATCIVIPCNTAHYWYDELVREGGLPILHIADAACGQFAAHGIEIDTVGLIGTSGTLAAGFFQQRLDALGYRYIASSARDQEELVLPAIESVKRNDVARAHALAVRAAQNLLDEGAQVILLACTELPPAIEHAPSAVAAACIDPTRALARASVAWWRSVSNE